MPSAALDPRFQTTRWTLVLQAQVDATARRRMIESLATDYWSPLYTFARRRGLGAEDARDAVQDFLAELLERDLIERADPARGRFRSLLRTAFANFLGHQREAAAASKRGGGRHLTPLDEVVEASLAAAPTDPGRAFDRAWAQLVMTRAEDSLRAEFDSARRSGPFAVFAASTRGTLAPLADIARDHGMTIPQVKSFLHRTRERFRELVMAQIADTTGGPADRDLELNELLLALGD